VDILIPTAHPRLDVWRSRPYSRGVESGPDKACRRDAYELEITREPAGEPTPDGPFERAAAAILRYEIFPTTLLTPVVQRTPLQVGDTVGARYHFAPGVDLFFASRVVAVIRTFDAATELHRAGFTYRTLEGHPEFGEETFCVEKHAATGAVVVALRSWSRAGNWLSKLGWPLARRLQVSASRGALTELRDVACAVSARDA